MNYIVEAFEKILHEKAHDKTSPLSVLANPLYPERQIRLTFESKEIAIITLAKYRFEYKHRGRRPSTPPPADTDGILSVLRDEKDLRDGGLRAICVEDKGTYVTIKLEVLR